MCRTTGFIIGIYAVFVAALLVCAPQTVCAQQSLSIVDALPPYDLTATLLANGHFSVSTQYTGESKTLIYREDGTGSRPVNYTSHVHFKVDNVVFQLPYELNPATREAPPEHPLTITQLFRDTVAGRPRVNARLYGIMPDGDTMRFVFSMEPVKRPSGGFIRLSAEVENSTSKPRSVGVLMLVDTQIGSNDRAPIVTSFGYQNTETQYMRTTAPGMPEFWLALEGSPANPRLTARGNLRESDLIAPDIFLFGNWVDYTALGIPGLALAQWKERAPSGLEYTDSAVLLLWDEESMLPGQRRLRASTEIGIVDSLKVQFSPGTVPYDVVLAGAGTCLTYETVEENPCGVPGYHPYSPDSLQTLYIVTNRGTTAMNNVRVVVPTIPTGLSVASAVNSVIPNTLASDVTGVATVTFYAAPRLQTTTFEVPVAVMAGIDTVMFDTVCVVVPGLLGDIELADAAFRPLCPGYDDTLDVRLHLDGVRCLDIVEIGFIPPNPTALFDLVLPLPTEIPANDETSVRVRYSPNGLGDHSVRLFVTVRDSETLTPGNTTVVLLSDTCVITGTGRNAEYHFAKTTDTLDFGRVCIGDTVESEWTIENVGGCDLVVDSAFVRSGILGQFDVANSSAFPVVIPRGERYTTFLRFTPQAEGDDQAFIVVAGQATPLVDTLVVRGRGDRPQYTVPASVVFDTLCPGNTYTQRVTVTNPTACPVVIDSIRVSLADVRVSPADGFTIPALGAIDIVLRTDFALTGNYAGAVTLFSSSAGEQTMGIEAVVRDRALTAIASIDFGDVRLGTSTGGTLVLTAAGAEQTNAEVVLVNVRILGANSSEYTLTIPPGTFPHRLLPGESISLPISFTPGELEQRRAEVVVDIMPGTICGTIVPIELLGRGILPVIDIPRRTIDFGRVCVGQSIDTVILVRNLGNAPLSVSGTLAEGATDIEVLGGALPAVIEPDSSRFVRIRFAPTRLGEITTDIYVLSDGEWFTRPDTLLRLTGTGIVCAEVWVDTLYLATGSIASIPVRIRPAAGVSLQSSDIQRLMNESGNTALSLSIVHGARLFRFRNEPAAGGMLQSAPVLSQPGRVTVAVGNNVVLRSSDDLAVLRGDVLLGDRFDSDLELSVSEFANGYSRVVLRSGLLVSEYCALDRRYVNASGVQSFVQPRQTPLALSGALDMYIAQSGFAKLVLVDATGRQVAELYNGMAAKGVHEISLGGVLLPSGVYTAVLDATGERSAVPVMIVP